MSGKIPHQVLPDPATDNRYIVMHSLSTSTAFICIVQVLDLNCAPDSVFHIRAPAHILPPAIAPTLKQQVIPHKSYIDMLPWSTFRDRMLDSLNVINETEFVLDMASGDLKVWGSAPWDPAAWEVGPDFAKKWWFLLDDGIIHTTNFWRGQRGEEPLILAPPWATSC
jgi:Domain of unknown function (DUF3425)